MALYLPRWQYHPSMTDHLQTHIYIATATLTKDSSTVSSSRPQTSTRARFVVDLSLSARMLSVVSRFFEPSPPITEIAGCKLTQDAIAQLNSTCTVLKRTLNIQRDAIDKLFHISDERAGRAIRNIQNRHVDIQIQLNTITFKTQHSTEPWVHEFANAQTTLREKIVTLNRRSRSVDWKIAARIYWPIIAETYTWLWPLVVRLQVQSNGATQQHIDLAAGDIRLQMWLADTQQCRSPTGRERASRVRFQEEATLRTYQIGSLISERIENGPGVVNLIDGKTRNIKRFQDGGSGCKASAGSRLDLAH